MIAFRISDPYLIEKKMPDQVNHKFTSNMIKIGAPGKI